MMYLVSSTILVFLICSVSAFKTVGGYKTLVKTFRGPLPSVRRSVLLDAIASPDVSKQGVCISGREVRLMRKISSMDTPYFEHDTVVSYDEEEEMCLLESGQNVQPSLLSDLTANVKMFHDASVNRGNRLREDMTKTVERNIQKFRAYQTSDEKVLAPTQDKTNKTPTLPNWAKAVTRAVDLDLLLNMFWFSFFTTVTFNIIMNVLDAHRGV